MNLDPADWTWTVEFYARIPSPRWTLALITLIDHQHVPPSAISPLMSFRKIAIVVGVILVTLDNIWRRKKLFSLKKKRFWEVVSVRVDLGWKCQKCVIISLTIGQISPLMTNCKIRIGIRVSHGFPCPLNCNVPKIPYLTRGSSASSLSAWLSSLMVHIIRGERC